MKKKLTDKERMYMIHILRDARELICSGKEYFICYAIGTAAWEMEQAAKDHKEWDLIWKVSDRLTDWIADLLGEDCVTLGSWLIKEGYLKTIPTHGIKGENSKKLRHTRLAWIDWMIDTIGEA